MKNYKYDAIVFGGGTAGISAAYNLSENGIKTLLVEKSDVLGGAITQGLVVPCMKLDDKGLNTDFINKLITCADKYHARHTYVDGNKLWFNPELLKIVFDDMLNTTNCDVLYSTNACSIQFDNIFKVVLNHKILSLYVETKYIVDATANGEIFKILNCNFQKNNNDKQMPTLRFIINDIDIEKFNNWILEADKDRAVTTSETTVKQIYLSTACTWDSSRNWALYPIFARAVRNGDLEEADTAYFQVFSIPNMPSALAFNCPRIFIDDNEDISDPFTYSKALKQGRERIYRLYNFLKKYFPGFENASIGHIADYLGVRESNRIKGKYTLTAEDIISNKKFDNIAFYSNYPIDIHSADKSRGGLEFTKHTYSVPIECLISADYPNLYAAGRIISADFKAQAAVRTQVNCFSMGEAVAKDIISKIQK